MNDAISRCQSSVVPVVWLYLMRSCFMSFLLDGKTVGHRSGSASMDKNDSVRGARQGAGCGCPVLAFQKMVSGKYKVRILWDLKDGARRYGEIRSGLLRGGDGSARIAPRALSRELKALATAGLIGRRDYGTGPPQVDYRLTPRGRSFVPIIDSILQWDARPLAGA